ncbi:11 kDa late embryogenesis abundant protein-like [Phragmites australis]|uniref:11 kDa late embryogenesis abundant protein-like n=1 Tax=Phragmites australis TaxID=29695 RepID=UPI002D797E8D|nr:11 kDa late embryogenesis abundant protein-like [Phragmites australis]
MQGGKSTNAAEVAKEAAANVGASAWAGKEKTKAVLQEKGAKMKVHDPAEKAAADARMQERVREVEAIKQDAMRHNAATKERATAAEHHPTPTAPLSAGAVAQDRSSSSTGGHDDAGAVPIATETGTGRPDAVPHESYLPASGTGAAGGRCT